MWQYFLWGGIFVAALVIEGLTLQLMSIWFSVGALAALISSLTSPSPGNGLYL